MASDRRSVRKRHGFWWVFGKTVATIGWAVLCVLAYFICQGALGGYPAYNTFLLTSIAMIVIGLLGGFAWILDEHRQRDIDAE